MLRKVTVVFLSFVLFAGISFPQSKKLQKEQMRLLKDARTETASGFYKDYLQRKSRIEKSGAALQDLMFANYDWIYNDYVPTMLVMHDFTGDGVKDPIAVGVHNVPTRHTRIAYVDELGASSYPLYGTDSSGAILRNGWNSMIILDEAQNALYPVTYDALSGDFYFYLWAIDLATDITAATKVTTDGYALSWPRAALLGNGDFLAFGPNIDNGTANTGNFVIMRSTDGGNTFDSIGVIGQGDPKVWSAGDSPFTSDPLIETNGVKVSIFLGMDKLDVLEDIYSGVSSEDSAGSMYHYYSNDGGDTWQGEIIEIDGKKGQVFNRPDQWSLVQLWDVGDFSIDATGVTHLIHIGAYSVGVDGNGDTINVSPMYYWNDRDKHWLSIADPVVEYNYAYPPSGSDTTYPANMNGNSAPTIAVSDNGQVVAAVWVIPEYSGALGTSAINVYPGDGGANSSAVFYTDLVYSFSSDRGVTWSTPAMLESQKMFPEQWPVLAPKVEIAGNQATINYMYYMDPIPGSSIVGPANGPSNDSKWVYNSKTFDVGSVSVGDNPSLVRNYSLSQNFPNPFNPGTEIKYTLAEKSNVTLKVFDILGKEVANLVNGTVEAGDHTVNFNASNLASGVYMYTINAGNFTMTKKMMLMK